MSNSKYDKRVYAGYYKRYDGKLFYVVTMAKDGVTGEDVVIYMQIGRASCRERV